MNTKWRDNTRLVHAVDLYVAYRLRELRREGKVSVTRMAAILGLTAREYRKYETGAASMPVGILYLVGVHLGVPLSQFYPDAGRTAKRERVYPSRVSDLLQHFEAVGNSELRRALVETSGLLMPLVDGNDADRALAPESEKVVSLRRVEAMSARGGRSADVSAPRSA